MANSSSLNQTDTWRHSSGCPRLFLAPMEGLGDHFFRRAITRIGGFDEGCTPFLSVPSNAKVRSLARAYDPHLMAPYPQAAQIMGCHPELMADMAAELERRGAPRIDLNCGCPSNTVTGRGAGSSLLREPEHLHRIASAMVNAVSVPVTVKLRSGYQDTSLFKENLLAAQNSGAAFLTLHPRTKAQGYKPPCPWELLAEAKEIIDVPLIGSGDVRSVEDAKRMLRETGCDGIMIGRGAVGNPWIFHDIKSHFENNPSPRNWEDTEDYLTFFFTLLKTEGAPPRTQINKVKQMVRYLFGQSEELVQMGKELLRDTRKDPDSYFQTVICRFREVWTHPAGFLSEIMG